MGALRYLQDVGSRAQWCSSSHHFLWQAGLSVLLFKVGLLLGIFEPALRTKIARARNTSCPTCVGGCRTVELNGKAPSKVQNLFKHVSSQMKSNLKTLNWQDAQKKSILEHKVILISLIAIKIRK